MVIENLAERIMLGITALAVTLALVFFGLYRHEATKRAEADVALAGAKAANTTNNGTIETLTGRLSECNEKNRANADALATAMRERQAAEAAQHEAEQQERALHEKLYQTDSTCGAMRRAVVCSAVADRLRARAQAADRNAND